MPSLPTALLLLVAFTARAAAQFANYTSVRPPSYNNDTAFLFMSLPTNNDQLLYPIVPLTSSAYNRLPHASNDTSTVNTSVVLGTPGQTTSANSIPPWAVAYISCDAQDYGGNIDMMDVVNLAIAGNATGILFYSEIEPFCNITNATALGAYANFYSMNSTYNATTLLAKLTGPFLYNQASLLSGIVLQNVIASSNNNAVLGAGGTAIAMIILYSITGVITALFLVIIITGAIRAHRHPERYGPRNVLGRARQSRAKGIARAMLDTIPIVKFGESREQPKDVEGLPGTELRSQKSSPPGVGGEMAEGAPMTDADITAAGITTMTQGGKAPEVAALEENTASSSAQDAANSHPEEDAQGCSICTDDFERGQDIRVLPCGHQFHPACVDPWLLEVSGTCPLCRVDLHPATNPLSESDDLPPPLDPESSAPDPRSRRDTLRAFFARTRGANDAATREERLEALRSWRAQNQAAAITTADGRAGNVAESEVEGGGLGPEVQVDHGRLSRLGRLIRRR